MSSEILRSLDVCVDKEILIKLRNHTTIKGNLKYFDQQMNLTLTNCQDITEEKPKDLHNILLRGDNILVVSLPETK